MRSEKGDRDTEEVKEVHEKRKRRARDGNYKKK